MHIHKNQIVQKEGENVNFIYFVNRGVFYQKQVDPKTGKECVKSFEQGDIIGLEYLFPHMELKS